MSEAYVHATGSGHHQLFGMVIAGTWKIILMSRTSLVMHRISNFLTISKSYANTVKT